MGLPRSLKWYVECTSMDTKTVGEGSDYGAINNDDTPQLAAPPRVQPVLTRSGDRTRMSCPLHLLSRLWSGVFIRDRSVRHEPDMSQPNLPTTELNLAAQPDLYPTYENSPCEIMRI